MKPSRRTAWLLCLLGLGLFLAILFRAFILANFVIPVAIVLWLFWRFVQSVHQALYWGLLILLAGGFALYRLARAVAVMEGDSSPTPATILQTISYWRMSILLTSVEGPGSISLKRELRQMLVRMYATKQPEAAPFSIYEALRLRQQPLPDSLYAFLFPGEALEAKQSWMRRLAAKPRKWIHQWTGRDKAEHYRSIEETLTFMEALMEIKHGDEYFDLSNH